MTPEFTAVPVVERTDSIRRKYFEKNVWYSII